MKQTITVHVAGRSREIEPVDMMPILVSADGGYRYAILETAAHSPGVCGKNVAFVDEDNKTVERLLGVEEIATAIRVTEAAKAASPKSPWIPVTERLPKKGEDGRDCTWVHCIVSVMRSCGGNWADGDVGTHVFPAPAMFDVDQKIWHVGAGPAEFTVNALIPLVDSDGGYFVTHWMLYPKPPQEGSK